MSTASACDEMWPLQHIAKACTRLWKMSCVSIVAIPVAFGICDLTVATLNTIFDQASKREEPFIVILVGLVYFTEVFIAALYLVTRTVLLVLPLLQLRALEDGALAETRWSTLIPHVG